MTNLTDPLFTNEDAAREHFEKIRWPGGKPVCPHCGVVDQATRLEGKSHRPGLYVCRTCREHFTVTVGTVMESSHVPLHKWALGFHLMASSKKGISAHQLMRNLGLGSYRTAWFMAHRIREAMADRDPEPLGGKGKTVEVDETYIGKPESTFVNGKGWVGKRGTATKRKVLTMVERGGRCVSIKVDDLTIPTIKKILGVELLFSILPIGTLRKPRVNRFVSRLVVPSPRDHKFPIRSHRHEAGADYPIVLTQERNWYRSYEKKYRF